MADINDLFDELSDVSDDEDEIQGGKPGVGSGAEHLIILLDCHEDMFVPKYEDPEFPDDKISRMDEVLRQITNLVKLKLKHSIVEKTSHRDNLGIILYNTRFRTHHSNKSDHKARSHEVLAPAPLGVDTVLELRKLQEDPLSFQPRELDLQELYSSSGSKASEVLRLGLLEAHQKLQTVSKPQDTEQIWVFTCHPPGIDDLLLSQIEDLPNTCQVTIYFPPDMKKDKVVDIKGVEMTDETPSLYAWKQHRPFCTLPFYLSESLEITVDLYPPTVSKRYVKKWKVHKQSGKVLESVKQYMDGAKVLKSSKTGLTPDGINLMRSYVEVGKQKEKILVSRGDLVEVKKSCNLRKDASLTLLGFKSRDDVPWEQQVKNPYLLFPGNSDVPGHQHLFWALHKQMLEGNIVAIGEILTRSTALSRIVAIKALPGTAFSPPGLVCTHLPFQEELKCSEADFALQALEEGRSALQPELESLFLKFIDKQSRPEGTIGENFPDASEEDYWNYIESVVLSETKKDLSKNHPERLLDEGRKSCGSEIDMLINVINQIPDDEKIRAAVKRNRREDPQPDDTSGLDWFRVFESGFAKVTVADLKTKLRSLGLPVTGVKSALIDRLSQYFEEHPPVANRPEEVVSTGVNDNSKRVKKEFQDEDFDYEHIDYSVLEMIKNMKEEKV